MPLDGVIDDLLGQAKATAELKLREANIYRESTIARAKEEADVMRVGYAERLRSDTEKLMHAAAREAQIEVARERQAMLKRIIDQAYSELIGRVLEEKERKLYLPAFMGKAARELGGGTIHVRPEDARLAGVPHSFKLQKDLTASSGIVAESPDGTLLLDMTIETLVQDFWQKNIALVHQLLLG